MSEPRGTFAVTVLVLCAVLSGILAYVEYRVRIPEWKPYQEKGIVLAIQRAERNLATATSPVQQKQLAEELESLRHREPEIIEIKPFGGKLGPERCLTCHFGIEDLSASHPNSVFGCVSCHGGNGPDLTVKGAHRGLRGGRNPAVLDLAKTSCGSTGSGLGQCHSRRESHLLDRVENVPRSLMATNAGIISTLRFQWGMEEDTDPRFGVKGVTDSKSPLRAVPPERTAKGKIRLAESHFRKFCATCHLWNPRHRKKMGRLAGCPACHAPYGEDGRYHGCDPTVDREEIGHPFTHTITNAVPDERCRACHNRSGRVGLNYHGEMESAQYGTPFVRGVLNNRTISDDRFILHLVPDIHHEKGMGCIDCHTGQDTMGDGVVHSHMEDQIEIRCEDCHGSYSESPKTMKVEKDDPVTQALIRSSPFAKPSDGEEILQTSKGRPLPHVRKTSKGFRLTSKLTGKEHPVSVITGKKNAHRIKGHSRLECDSCHSAWSPQCYGCHQLLDFGHGGLDHVSQEVTPGRWVEGRSYFRFFKSIFGINSRAKVGILVPGCQVWNTVVDSRGKVIPPYDSTIMKLRNGLTSTAVGPTHPHTTRTEVPRCVDCHLDPKALGLGEGRLHWNFTTGTGTLEPLYDSHGSGLKIDFPPEAVVSAEGKVLQSTSHKLSRPFNREEIRKIVAIAPCLTCHNRYDDPVWEKEGPYRLRPPCVKALGD